MAEETKAWQQNRWIDCTLEDVTDDEIKRALMHASSQANLHFKSMVLIGRNGSLKMPSYFKQHFTLVEHLFKKKYNSQIEFIGSSPQMVCKDTTLVVLKKCVCSADEI